MVKVVLEHIKKYFGNVKAVDDVSLEVQDKEFVTFLGPSGSGKTTLLRSIAGLETVSEGNIFIGDTKVNDLAPKDRDVAMVFQSYALYPHMTVYENLAFPLKLRKHPKDEIESVVKQTAELLDIGLLLKRKPKELSGGQQQRVALGRAIVRHPKVFLMDEPLSNLDAKLRVYMRTELIRLQKRLSTTLIYVTHDQVEAMTMSDRVALMNDGKIMQVDDPKKLYDSPSNVFVGGFIGTPPMNFLNCGLTESNGKTYATGDSFKVDVSDFGDLIRKNVSTSELTLGIRPEDIKVSRGKLPADGLEAEVYVTEALGSETIVNLKLGENVLKAKCEATFKPSMGERVWLQFDKQRMHIFDSKTEKVIV